MQVTALYIHLASGHTVRVTPEDKITTVFGDEVPIEKIAGHMTEPDYAIVVPTKAQEAATPEEFEAIMDSEAEPWAQKELPPVYVAYDTIYARGVSSIVMVTNEETTDE